MVFEEIEPTYGLTYESELVRNFFLKTIKSDEKILSFIEYINKKFLEREGSPITLERINFDKEKKVQSVNFYESSIFSLATSFEGYIEYKDGVHLISYSLSLPGPIIALTLERNEKGKFNRHINKAFTVYQVIIYDEFCRDLTPLLVEEKNFMGFKDHGNLFYNQSKCLENNLVFKNWRNTADKWYHLL